jgi:hypothetical protein
MAQKPIVRSHRVRLPKSLPPFAGHKMRRRVPGSGLSAPTFVVRRRAAPKIRCPLPATIKGRARHGKLIGLGTSQQFFRVLYGRRKSKAWPLPQYISFRRRRLGQQRTLVGNVVAGPYWWAAGQLYTAGAVAGQVRSV